MNKGRPSHDSLKGQRLILITLSQRIVIAVPNANSLDQDDKLSISPFHLTMKLFDTQTTFKQKSKQLCAVLN